MRLYLHAGVGKHLRDLGRRLEEFEERVLVRPLVDDEDLAAGALAGLKRAANMPPWMPATTGTTATI
jgi:hypothetical protein